MSRAGVLAAQLALLELLATTKQIRVEAGDQFGQPGHCGSVEARARDQ